MDEINLPKERSLLELEIRKLLYEFSDKTNLSVTKLIPIYNTDAKGRYCCSVEIHVTIQGKYNGID